MTQAQEVDRWLLRTFWGFSHTGSAMDSKRVCEIVGQIAAEVLSEVRAGTWRPPTTLRINMQLHRSQATEEDR